MSEDRIRALFRQADASLGHAPPQLDATIRQARREQSRARVFGGIGVAAVVVLAAALSWVALRPDTEQVTPITSPSAAPPAAAPCGKPANSGAQPARPDEVKTFIDDFMRRRIAGSGAEPCLSDEAVGQYRESHADTYDPNANGGAGPLCLYACGAFRVVEYYFDTEPHQEDANSYQSAVIVQLSNGQETVRQYEAFAIGPGRASTGRPQLLVIRGVWNTPGLP